MMHRLRPNILALAFLLAAVATVDILDNGTAQVGLAAIGGLIALGKDLLAADRRDE